MYRLLAALVAAASCLAPAQAQELPTAPSRPTNLLTLEQAIEAAGGAAPAADVARADVAAAQAARRVAGLRPNPTLNAEIENVGGSGPYRDFQGAETTVDVSVPIELGGKRGARVGVANARVTRAHLAAAITAADIRLQLTELYIAAVSSERRLDVVRDQARIAAEAADAARARVQAGRASPIEEQRANVARLNAGASAEQARLLLEAARANLARRIGQPVSGALDRQWLEAIPASLDVPVSPSAAGTLTLAAAEADLSIANAGVRLAQSQRIPDVAVGAGWRRFSDTDDTALLFKVSVPIPVFNSGRSALAQARAERNRAEAQQRVTALEIEQAILTAQTEANNAAIAARVARGPALAAAEEAARIARIGYREGKFGQLELLDAERTLAETRLAAIDALVAYQTASARLERLVTPAPDLGMEE